MLRALEPWAGAERLRQLLQRYRAEAMTRHAALHDLHLQLEYWHREAAIHRLAGQPGPDPATRRCQELQAECDHLGVELSHIRLAIVGITEELHTHDLPQAIHSVA